MASAASQLISSFSTFSRSKPRVILGSSSPWRRSVIEDLAEEFDFKYEVIPADIDERAIRFANPEALVSAISRAKADAVVEKLKQSNIGDHEAYILTGDQVVVCNGKILEKPLTEEEAVEFIEGYAEHPAQTVGSVMCTHVSSLATAEKIDTAKVYFDPIPQDTIRQLIDEGGVFRAAGGLLIENALVSPHIRKIVGKEDAVRGMSRESAMEVFVNVQQLKDHPQ